MPPLPVQISRFALAAGTAAALSALEAVGGLGLVTGNPGLARATGNCATPKG